MLTREEARAAYRIGQMRSDAARRRNGRHTNGWKPGAKEQRHIDGMSSVAECYVAKEVNRRWLSYGMEPDPPGQADCDGELQVRWVTTPGGTLKAYKPDPLAWRYVLVAPNYLEAVWPDIRIVGWMPAVEMRQPKWWRETDHNCRSEGWFVKQGALDKLESLLRLLDQEEGLAYDPYICSARGAGDRLRGGEGAPFGGRL